jgi:hypothetical protein
MRSHEEDGRFAYLFGNHSEKREKQNKDTEKKVDKKVSGPVPLAFTEQECFPAGISLGFLEQASRPLSSAFEQALDGERAGKAITSPRAHVENTSK